MTTLPIYRPTMSTSGPASVARVPTTNLVIVLAKQANRLQQQEQQIQELIVAVTMLNNALGRDSQIEKITRPKKYNGDKEALHPFLIGIDLYFFKKAPRYTIDVSKVVKICKFLKG